MRQYWKAKHALAAVVVVHGHGSSVLHNEGGASVLTMAIRPLVCAGFVALGIDLRNHGKSSDARPVSLGYLEADDVLSAAEWLVEEKGFLKENVFLTEQLNGLGHGISNLW